MVWLFTVNFYENDVDNIHMNLINCFLSNLLLSYKIVGIPVNLANYKI